MDLNKIVLNLRSFDRKLRIEGSEEIRDIYEFKYQHSVPPQYLIDLFVNQLVESILVEKDDEVQYAMLDALHAWAWFPCDDRSYDVLANSLNKILDETCLAIALEILFASGDKKYKSIYQKYFNSKYSNVSNIAKKAINAIKEK
jgi:hypothetical protein